MSGRVNTAPLPLLLLLLLAAITTAAGQTDVIADNPALHRLNDRVISSAFTGRNEVVCTYCLFQVVSAAYQVGNDVVRREIRDALGSKEPKGLSEALLNEAERLSTLNGTLTGYYQQGAFDGCPTRTKRDQCASIASLLHRRGEEVDFRSLNTVKTINSAVERATDGKIRDLFTSLANSTQLVFTSTLVFSDQWVTRLRAVKDEFLPVGDRNPVMVPTLINKSYMPVLDSSDGVQGVSMSYRNPAIRLYCFVAKDEGSDIKQLLHKQHYLDLARAPERYTQVRMPKFDLISQKHSYVDFMKLMGIQKMFKGGLGPTDKLKVDQLVHKAVIQTDEDGTSAAGAAGFSAMATSFNPQPPPFVMRFNKPFVCSLVHADLGQPLFTAYIVDPRTN